MSKRARWQRGQRLTPNWQRTKSGSSYEFGFFSARGPANAQGHWVVTVDDNDGGCSGGGGDPGGDSGGSWTHGEPDAGTQVSYITIQWVKYFLDETSYDAGDHGVGINEGHPWPYDLQPYPYPEEFIEGRSRTFDRGRSDEGAYTYHHSTGTVYPSNSAPYPGYLIDYSRVDVRFAWGMGVPPADRVAYWHHYYYEVSNYGVVSLSGGGSAWEPPFPLPGEEDGSDPGDDGCSGGDFSGKYHYSCTCPDYTKQQPKLLAPRYPSDYRARSWTNSSAGALPGPPKFCKHIAAVANLLNDGEFFLGIDFGSDISETTFSPRQHYSPRPASLPGEDFREFWQDIDRFLQQRRRQQQLNNDLDWLSRLRPVEQERYVGVGYKQRARGNFLEETFDSRPTGEYIDFYEKKTHWGYSSQGKNMTDAQFNEYFRDTIRAAVPAAWW